MEPSLDTTEHNSTRMGKRHQSGHLPGPRAPFWAITDWHEWIDELEFLTREDRERLADEHDARGEEMGGSEWHETRARGLRRRFERVRACGLEERRIRTCCEHGHETSIGGSCADWRTCDGCRGRRRDKYRVRFEASRQVVLGKSLPFRERFLTLTVPADGDTAERRGNLVRAWQHLRRKLRGFMGRAPWYYAGAYEATTGADALGHVHAHVWLYSPYLPHELVRLWYGSQLECPTRPLEQVYEAVRQKWPDDPGRARQYIARLERHRPRGMLDWPWPVIDIRAWKAKDARELFKYTLKDAEYIGDEANTRAYMAPDSMAVLYVASLKKRQVFATLGFWALGEDELEPYHCPQCGSVDTYIYVVGREEPGDDGPGT